MILFDRISMTQENLSNLIKIKIFDSFEEKVEKVEISTFEEISTFSIFPQSRFYLGFFP